MEHCSLCFTHPMPFLLCTSKQVHIFTKLQVTIFKIYVLRMATEDDALEYVQ